MDLRDIRTLNYLTDNEKGMQQLIIWFLNDVKKGEVAEQGGCIKICEKQFRKAHRTGYRPVLEDPVQSP
jgi:hypothetical protein